MTVAATAAQTGSALPPDPPAAANAQAIAAEIARSAIGAESAVFAEQKCAQKHIALVGMGAGERTLTPEARELIESAGCLIGSRRPLLDAQRLCDCGAKRCFTLIDADAICSRIETEPDARFAVLFSGDTGFFSGAKRLLPLLRERGWQRTVAAGISSLSLFAARLETSWEDAALISLHGREADGFIDTVAHHAKTFFLTGGEKNARFICAALCEAGLGELPVSVGERLGCPDERLYQGSAAACAQQVFDGMSVVMAENPAPRERPSSALPDEAFIRGKTPMTKAETRIVSLDKLRLAARMVCWDVGAGTGAVACDMARRVKSVYAIEKDEAARELIGLNRARFGLGNLRVIAGAAPQALSALPAPDSVFIGGSGGALGGIFEVVLAKNRNARIVVNAITPETAVKASRLFEKYNLNNQGMIQLAVSRARKAGRARLLQALNPIFIIWGGGPDERI